MKAMTLVFLTVVALNIGYCTIMTYVGRTSVGFEIATAVPVALVNAISTLWLWNGGKFRRN